MWSNPRAAVDYRETNGGDVREETVVGNAGGGKPGSHGSKAILLSGVGGKVYSLSPHTPASVAEQYRGWPIKCLTH